MTTRKKIWQNLAYLGVAVLSGTTGAALALLMAPRSGRDTRRRLMRSVKAEKKILLRKGHRAMDKIGERIEDRWEEGKRALGA